MNLVKKIIIGIVVGAILVIGIAVVFDLEVQYDGPKSNNKSVQIAEQKMENEPALFDDRNELSIEHDTAVNTITGQCTSGYTSELNESSAIVWRGTIDVLMTYGRYRIKKYPEDNQLPIFVAELDINEGPYASHKFKVGDFVEVRGQFEEIVRNDFSCEPWVLADTIQLSKK